MARPLLSTVYTGPPESPLMVQDPDVLLATTCQGSAAEARWRKVTSVSEAGTLTARSTEPTSTSPLAGAVTAARPTWKVRLVSEELLPARSVAVTTS